MSRFESDTAVHRVGAPAPPSVGELVHFDATIDHSWWVVMGPNGGYIGAIVARAVCAAAGEPDRRLHSITLHYLRPPREGPCRVEVVVERIGRGVTTVTARLLQEDRLIVVAVAALAVRRDSIRIDQLAAPTVSAPEDLSSPTGAGPPIELAQHFDLRPVFGHIAGGADAPGVARSGGWMRYVDPTPVDEVVLVAFADAWWPPLMEVVEVPIVVPTVDLTVHLRALPADADDFVLGEYVSPLAADGYLVEDARLWSRDGTLLAESRQLAVLM